MHPSSLNFEDVLVFLFAAGVAVPLMRRIGVNPVLGFLAVGVLIGPFGLVRFADAAPWIAYGVIDDVENVRALAELGVVFLLFMIGLELSLERLWSLRRLVFGLGGAQVVVTACCIALIASLFGNTLEAAIVLGASFALSSTAVVIQLLIESRRMSTVAGRASFAVLLFQDLAVLPILLLITAFGADQSGSPALAIGKSLLQAAVAIVAILAVGRLVIRPIFRIVGVTESREMFLAFVLLAIIGIAALTEAVGLSMALGAFLAGLMFAETEYRYSIEADIEPFKGLLLGLFFISVGMSVDPAQVLARPFWLILAVVGLFVIKGVILFGLARLFGESRAVAAEMALTLGQGGEFAFLVVGLSLGIGLIDGPTAQFMLLVTALTMIVTPAAAQAARRLSTRLAAEAEPAAAGPDGLEGHVVIAGYGRVGQFLGQVLAEIRAPYIAIDNDSLAIAGPRKADAALMFGDASREEILERCRIDQAAALVLTMDQPRAAEAIARAVRKRWPNTPVYARARDAAHAAKLLDAGAFHVVPETTEASLQLCESLLGGIGMPGDAAHTIVDMRRRAEQTALEALSGKK